MRQNGLLALDIDPRNGGDATLKRITDEHGPLSHAEALRFQAGVEAGEG